MGVRALFLPPGLGHWFLPPPKNGTHRPIAHKMLIKCQPIAGIKSPK